MLARDSLPEGVDLLDEVIGERLVGQFAFLRELLAHLDTENFLVLSNGPLIVNEDQDAPTDVLAEEQHTNGALQLAKVALEARSSLYRYVRKPDRVLLRNVRDLAFFLCHGQVEEGRGY